LPAVCNLIELVVFNRGFRLQVEEKNRHPGALHNRRNRGERVSSHVHEKKIDVLHARHA
jgi:hypothetical protein